MNTSETRKVLSTKSRRSSGSTDSFKSKVKVTSRKNEHDGKVTDAFTTFQYKKETSGNSDETETVFVFPRNWPEWNDFELNAEEWKNEDLEEKQKAMSSPMECYHDSEGVLLPHTQMRILESWKRPSEVFQIPLILYDDSVESIDIISANKHLLNSRCMRWIISSIAMVQTIAEDAPSPLEGENPLYIPNGGTTWRPWNHVYSLCKAGKVPHKPLLNPYGKYVVRLYYLGCWRKIVVDDKLPFDSKGKMLLPASAIRGELWPMILTKALLKIASHTWNTLEDPSGFHPITCLTGWICEELTTIEFDHFALWKLIRDALEEEEEIVVEEPHKMEVPQVVNSKKSKIKSDKSPKKLMKDKKEKPEVPEPVRKPKPTEILAVLSFWSQKYDASEVVQQIFSLKDPIKSTPMNEYLKRMNFPVLFQKYKEKGNTSNEKQVKDIYPWKKYQRKLECDKQNCIPECYIKSYSHFFGMVEEVPNATEVKKEDPVTEMDTKISKKEQKGKKMKKAPEKKKEKKAKDGDSSPTQRPMNMEKMMMDTGKWVSFNSLTTLLEGIILIHKPVLFASHIQKPDFGQLLSPKMSYQTDSLDNIDEESELCSEFAMEEKSYVCLDSAEEINFIVDLNILPTPTKLDENYSTAFDLMVNACEGEDEEYFNYIPSPEKCETRNAVQKPPKVANGCFNGSIRSLDQWVECENEFGYELEGDTEQHTLKEHLFLENDALVLEMSIDCDGEGHPDDLEWEVDEYELKMYRVKGLVKRRCERGDCHCKSNDNYPSTPDPMDETLVSQPFCEKRSMLPKKSEGEVQVNTFLLSNKLASSQQKHFKSLEDVEGFYGHPTMSYQPQSLRTATYLGIEVFQWDTRDVGHPEMQFNVNNAKTIHFMLPPGRHIFRLIIRSASFYSLHLLSNVGIFFTASKSDLYGVMKQDCARLAHYEKNIHQNFENLVNNVVNDGYVKAIRDFRNCYLPNCYGELQGDEKELIHKVFQEIMSKIVMENVSPPNFNDVHWALKVLFLDAKLKNTNNKSTSELENISTGSAEQRKESLLNSKGKETLRKEEEAAIKIQKIFRGFLNWKIYQYIQKDRETFSKNLDLILTVLKSKNNINIMRAMLDEAPVLKSIYALQMDLKNEINVYEWKGLTLEINRYNWIPLVRYIFKWKTEEPVMSSLYLNCPLDHWVLTVIDNDTGKEVPRLRNYCEPHLYNPNENGYTLFAYGLDGLNHWSTVPWKINQIVPKLSPPLQIYQSGLMSPDIEKLPKLRADTLSGYYIPNIQRKICSFFMKVKERCQISLCFTTSDKHVAFKFKLLNKKMDLISEEEREGYLVVPSMFLDGPEENEDSCAVYSGEVTLMSDWSLSDFQEKFAENQWIKEVAYNQDVILPTPPIQPKSTGKQNSQNSAVMHKPMHSIMDSKHKLGEPLIEQVVPPESCPATWRFEILLNSPQEVMLEQIKEKEDYLRNMKNEWEKSDPGILERNAELYNKYESEGFTKCLEYSKEIPTKFKYELPYFEEFHEKDSDDESTETKRRGSIARDRKLSNVQRRSSKSRRTSREHERIMMENIATPNDTHNTHSEKENTDDEDTNVEGLDSSERSDSKMTDLRPEHLIGHNCDISTDDIAGFYEVMDDRKKSINFHFILPNITNINGPLRDGSMVEANQRLTDISLYDVIYPDKSEYDLLKEHNLTNKNNAFVNSPEGNDDNLMQRKSILDENDNMSLSKEKIDGIKNEVETLFQKDIMGEDNVYQADHYKSYYIDDSDKTSSTSEEENNNLNRRQPQVMSIDDWVNIQSKMVQKQENFKKKLLKRFTEVQSLVRAPYEGHLAKWNLYMANVWKKSEEAFNAVEKPIDAFRRAKKKQEILRKQKIKDDMRTITMLKPEKKAKKNKKEKPNKLKEKVTKGKAKK